MNLQGIDWQVFANPIGLTYLSNFTNEIGFVKRTPSTRTDENGFEMMGGSMAAYRIAIM
jgi:hypothetical protein